MCYNICAEEVNKLSLFMPYYNANLQCCKSLFRCIATVASYQVEDINFVALICALITLNQTCVNTINKELATIGD